jgi:outer membrane protein OmpA-like peptidoglycan-associated protein
VRLGPKLQPASRTEEGSLQPSEETQATGDFLQVEFGPTETTLTSSSRAELKDLADRLRSQESLRLQLLAYADGEHLSPSKARRMSLSRALSVRSYLIENGIKTSRIDVRALGDKAPSAPMDRVDVKVVQR